MATRDYKRLHGMTAKQRLALPLVLAGRTDADVATACGVNRVTVTRWRLDDPAFQAALDQGRRELWTSAIDKLRSTLARAVEVLALELDGENKLQAAVHALRLAGLGRLTLDPAAEELEERVASLEEAVGGTGGQRARS